MQKNKITTYRWHDLSLFRAKRHGYLTLMQKLHIKIVKKKQLYVGFTAMDVQKQFSIFHNYIFNTYISPNYPGELSILCTRHVQSLKAKFTHFKSRVGWRGGEGGLLKLLLQQKIKNKEKISTVLKTSLDHVLSSLACPQPSTKIEFRPIITAST